MLGRGGVAGPLGLAAAAAGCGLTLVWSLIIALCVLERSRGCRKGLFSLASNECGLALIGQQVKEAAVLHVGLHSGDEQNCLLATELGHRSDPCCPWPPAHCRSGRAPHRQAGVFV